MSWYRFERQPTVAERRAKAIRAFERLRKEDASIEPVVIEGTKIARTFWGKAWCDNLEAYRDFEYRLPRGRSYVRHRAVLDLKVHGGRIDATVLGSSRYDVQIKIKPLPTERWQQFKRRSAGSIASLIELLKGELSDYVIRQIIDRDEGLFPGPDEIKMNCSCPDWAGMCKHVAAAMYGVGHRLDTRPELLFTLREVDPAELIDHAATMGPAAGDDTQATIAADQLGDIFGIELDGAIPPPKTAKTPASTTRRTKRQATKKKSSKKKSSRKNARLNAKSGGRKKATRKTSKRVAGTAAATTSSPSSRSKKRKAKKKAKHARRRKT